ncbi:MAG: hypothetical protein A3J46_01345 [Candidatus Yanofskybacteria bacterium RIFCSPHIGHO2_02_FULL_41_11]|uniref:POTRA domain-containing protein n=1 Tax=Candidatus Yanofskybacteria bacterium RIFCSPHIGHO2_02_FULL_41_11 TaxID=1802675 RepID=A0A1F8FA36_9BACT|nr:MAG: hypothetical protein A3J46_01345 [Candidatus Yanofskybacteria bacterium RIFCSPHIGHO2_02_FULL_41_11]
MKNVGKLFLFLILATTISLAPALAQELPEVNEMMNTAIQKVLEDDKLKAERLTYYKRYTEQKIEERRGKIVPKGGTEKQELYYVFAKNGMFFEELTQKNGRLPSEADRVEKMADKRPDIEDILGRNRYNFRLLGVSEYNTKQVYSVSFEPKHPFLQPKVSAQDPLKKVAENEILNNLYGLIYVDQEDFVMIRVEAHLHRPPLRIKTGKLFRFDATFERELVDKISVNKRLTIIIKYAYVSLIWNFFEEFEKITIDYEDYRLIPPDQVRQDP